MAPIVLILAIIFFPITIASCLTYAAYQSYKRRRLFPPHDVERVRNLERTRQHDERGIEMRDLERPQRAFTHFQRSRLGRVVSTRIAPVAKRLPSLDFSGVGTIGGEGLVSVPKGRGDGGGSGKGRGKERASLENREFQQQELYARGPGEWHRGELEQPGMYEEKVKVGLVAPRPVKAVRAFTDVAVSRPPDSPFDAKDAQVADIWHRIEKREYPRKSFESVDLNDSKVWAKDGQQRTNGNTLSSWATFSTGGDASSFDYDPSRQTLDTTRDQLAHEASSKKDTQTKTAKQSASYLDTVQQRYAAAKSKAENVEADKVEAERIETQKKPKTAEGEETKASDFAIETDDESNASSEGESDSSDDSSDDDGSENDSSDEDSDDSSGDDSDDSSDDDSDAASTHSLAADSDVPTHEETNHRPTSPDPADNSDAASWRTRWTSEVTKASARYTKRSNFAPPTEEPAPRERERANTFIAPPSTLPDIAEGRPFTHPGMSRSNTYTGDAQRQISSSGSSGSSGSEMKRQPLSRAQTVTEREMSTPRSGIKAGGEKRAWSESLPADISASPSGGNSAARPSRKHSSASKKSGRSESEVSERRPSVVKRLGRKSVGRGEE